MKIKLTNMYVDDQDRALRFYTDALGFVKKGDYERIQQRGAAFTMPPIEVTGSTIAMLDDTCCNLVQLVQLAKW